METNKLKLELGKLSSNYQ